MIHGKPISAGVWVALFVIALIGALCVYGLGVESGWWPEYQPPMQQQEQPQQVPEGR